MGLPALRQEPSSQKATSKPRLRVVRPQARPGSRPKTRARTSNAAARQGFVFFAVVIVAVAVLGVGRVWLSVQAAQASIDAGKIRREIKTARYQGDLLEVQQSSLATPSRIQAVAGTTMGMVPATKITYLELKSEKAPSVAQAPEPAPSAQVRPSGVMEKVMDAVAGEAQVLLAGDVGLASTR